MQLDTLTCRAVALAAWQVSANSEKWSTYRQVYESDLKKAATVLTQITHEPEGSEFPEVREALKELHSEVLDQVACSLTTMSTGQRVDDDMAQFIKAMFSILDPRPPAVSPVPNESPCRDS